MPELGRRRKRLARRPSRPSAAKQASMRRLKRALKDEARRTTIARLEKAQAQRRFAELEAQSKAHEAQARLAAIVESSQDPILSKTVDGTSTTWNRGAEDPF